MYLTCNWVDGKTNSLSDFLQYIHQLGNGVLSFRNAETVSCEINDWIIIFTIYLHTKAYYQ